MNNFWTIVTPSISIIITVVITASLTLFINNRYKLVKINCFFLDSQQAKDIIDGKKIDNIIIFKNIWIVDTTKITKFYYLTIRSEKVIMLEYLGNYFYITREQWDTAPMRFQKMIRFPDEAYNTVLFGVNKVLTITKTKKIIKKIAHDKKISK